VRDTFLVAWLAGMALIAVSIAWGRATLAEGAGFANRYGVPAGLGLCGVYVAWARIEGAGRRIRQGILAVAALAMLGPNMYVGLTMGVEHARVRGLFMADLRAGVPPRELARRYWPLFYYSEGGMARKLELVSTRRLGPWARVERPPGKHGSLRGGRLRAITRPRHP
jgi:hypothetical protein